MSDLTKKIVIGLVYTLVIVSATYYLSPTKTITQTKTVTVEVASKQTESNTHSKTVEEVRSDGSKTTTTIVDNTTDSVFNKSKNINTETSKTVERSRNGMSIAVLAGLDVTNPSSGYIFAGQVAFPIPILPISILLQAQSNKTGLIGLELKLP